MNQYVTGTVIRNLREKNKMTQLQLAEKLGKGRATIAKWESDPLSISGANLCKLSAYFGCSIDYLLGISNERMPARRV